MDETIKHYCDQFELRTTRIFRQFEPKIYHLPLEEIRLKIHHLAIDWEAPASRTEEIRKTLEQLFSESYQEYQELISYLYKNNPELIKVLKSRTHRKPNSIKELLDIVEFYNKLRQFATNPHTLSGSKHSFIFLFGAEEHYKEMLKVFVKVNSFYYTHKFGEMNYHIFNALGIKPDFNLHAGTSLEDLIHYIQSHLHGVKPANVLAFGLCAGLQKNTIKNTVIFPNSFKHMYPSGTFLQIKSASLFKLKHTKAIHINNIFADLKTALPGFQNAITNARDISVSNLYVKEAYQSNYECYILNGIPADKQEMEAKSRIALKFKLGNAVLHKNFDCLEMEMNEIAKIYKGSKLGIYLQVADQIIEGSGDHKLIEKDNGWTAIPLDLNLYSSNVNKILKYYMTRLQ